MIIISSREFRDKIGKYLGMAKSGENIVLKSRENGSFKLVPVTEDDMVIDRKYILKPDEDLKRAIPFEEFAEGAKEHIRKLYKQAKK